MTVSYSAEVTTSSFAGFFRLLFRWRGSIYKLMWKESVAFFVLFYFFAAIYRLLLSRYKSSKYVFEQMVLYCQAYSSIIPLALLLGFYINAINSRWWNQFCAIPWPDRTAMYVCTYIADTGDHARLMRRTVMRYLNLSIAMTLAAVAPGVKKRFSTLNHFVDAGLLLPHEREILDSIKSPYNKFMIPLVWSMKLLARCRKENLILEDYALRTILGELVDIRSSLGLVFNYDWVPVPLVYTQVLTLAVHIFTLICIIGNQSIDAPERRNFASLDEPYVPVFSFFQFLFYMGWLKVGEQMINPFGEDDDDFNVNFLLDRHIKVSYMLVDEVHAKVPELSEDVYWDELEFDLPYTRVTKHQGSIPKYFNGSTFGVRINPSKSKFVRESSVESFHEAWTIDQDAKTNQEVETVESNSSRRLKDQKY